MKYKINNRIIEKIGLILLLIPFFFPEYFFITESKITTINKIMKIVSCTIIMIMYCKNKKISKILLTMSIYHCLWILSGIINKGNVQHIINQTIVTMFPCLLIEVYAKKDIGIIIESILLLFKIYIYINFLTLLIYPQGMAEVIKGYPVWFLGIDNKHITIIFPAMCLEVINNLMKNKKGKISSIVFLLICIISVFIRWSATSVIFMILIIVFLVLKKYIYQKKIFNFANYIGISIISFFGIVIFRMQNLLESFIVEVLKKDITLTGRVNIWDKVVKDIIQKPILGHGDSTVYNVFVFNRNMDFSHSHNLILNILNIGGILLLLNYIYMWVLIGKKMIRYRRDSITKTLSYFYFTFFIITLVESYGFNTFFILFLLGYYVKELIKTKRRENAKSN